MTAQRSKKAPDPNLERRVPPHSLEAEMAVLGGILLRNEALDQVRDLLAPEDFYIAAHQYIFRATITLYDRGDPIDPITLRNELKAMSRLDDIGGTSYINRLLEEVHTTANIGDYTRIVAENALLRRMLNTTYEIQGMVFDQRSDEGEMLEVGEVLDRSQHIVFEVARESVRTPYESLEEVINESLSFIDERMTSDSALAGHSTGYADLDNQTNGFKPGELIILAARPAMGKTSLALNIATNIAILENLPVLFFSLEMSSVQIGLRLMCSHAKVHISKVLKGEANEEEYARLSKSAGVLAELPIYIEDSGGTNMNSIRAKARRLKAEKGGLGLVVIDYMQLLASVRHYDSREREIATMSRSFKVLAKDLEVPVMALSQLNRQLESREDKRPRPSDLRESGSLEQDADMVMFVYRDVIYHPETEDPDLAELIIGKQRSGPTGTLKMVFLGEYTRFEQYTQHEVF